MSSQWIVSCEPVIVDDEPLGIVLFLTNGEQKQEATRVRFARMKSKNKTARARNQLRDEWRKVEHAAMLLNVYNGQPLSERACRWWVVLEPKADNPSAANKNESGIVVRLTDGTDMTEGTRVLFVRRNAKEKDKDFLKALSEAIKDAEAEAQRVNELYDAVNDAQVAADEASNALRESAAGAAV